MPFCCLRILFCFTDYERVEYINDNVGYASLVYRKEIPATLLVGFVLDERVGKKSHGNERGKTGI